MSEADEEGSDSFNQSQEESETFPDPVLFYAQSGKSGSSNPCAAQNGGLACQSWTVNPWWMKMAI